MLTTDQATHVLCQMGGTLPPPYRTFEGGTAVWVYAMTYGNGRLCIGHVDDCWGYDRGYCYATVAAAFAAADAWPGTGEPEGWKKNLQTGEYRKEFE